MEVREMILTQLKLVVEEFTLLPFPDDVDDEMLLESLRLDSIALTNLFITLEMQLGYIPREITEGIVPATIGELVKTYEEEIV